MAQKPALVRLFVIQAVLTPWFAWTTVRKGVAAASTCPSCDRPVPNPRNAAVIPSEFITELTDVVVTGDVQRAAALAAMTEDLPLGTTCAVALHYACDGCGTQAIEVVNRTFGRRTTGTTRVLRPMPMTPEFISALRGETGADDPALPVEPDDAPAAAEPE